jgi:hypothetical protein
MPFIVIQIADKAKKLKSWYGVNVAPEATMSDIYSQFACGELDNGGICFIFRLKCSV